LDLFCFENILLANLLVVLIQDSFLPTTLEALSESIFQKSLSTTNFFKYSTVIAVDRSFFASLRFQLFRAIIKWVRAYEAVRWRHTNHSGVVPTYKKARVLERACIVAKKGEKGPILREICSPKNVPLFRAPLTEH
jgi:hypothetical protein